MNKTFPRHLQIAEQTVSMKLSCLLLRVLEMDNRPLLKPKVGYKKKKKMYDLRPATIIKCGPNSTQSQK